MEIWVDLQGPDGARRCLGFWDGGQIYKVRVTSTVPGRWTWTSGSNRDDAGLRGQRGEFVSVAWTAEEKQANPNRRGFVRSTRNGHALEYADGTPCFWVGDFFYPASSFRYRWRDGDEDYPVDSPEGGYKDLVKFRKAQGFNYLFIFFAFPNWDYDGLPQTFKDKAGVPVRDAWQRSPESRAQEMANEEGQKPFFFPGRAVGYPDIAPDYFRINPAFFRLLDKKMDYAYAQGFQVFIETLRRDVAPYLKAYYGFTSPEPAQNAMYLYIRYIFARYQADPVVFGIFHYDVPSEYGLKPEELRIPIDLYHRRHGPPPFHQLVTTNVSGSTYRAWGHTDKAPWLTLHQTGNTPRDHTVSDLIVEMFRQPQPLPIYSQEPWYIGSDTPDERRKNRATMYASLLSGGLAGVAYQAQGLTRGVRENSKMFPKMWEAVKWQSANEVRLAPAFLMADGVDYRELVPQRELLSVYRSGPPGARAYWQNANNLPQEGWSFCLRTDDRRFFKLYFERKAQLPTLSGAIPGGVYRARWFDPRTGNWSNAGDGTLTSDEKGQITLPAFPTSTDDWGMSLTRN